MANIPFSPLQDTETRKPSKITLAFLVLFSLFLILSVVFIGLYVKEKVTVEPTNVPSDNSKSMCISSGCTTSAAGMFRKLPLFPVFRVQPNYEKELISVSCQVIIAKQKKRFLLLKFRHVVQYNPLQGHIWLLVIPFQQNMHFALQLVPLYFVASNSSKGMLVNASVNFVYDRKFNVHNTSLAVC